MTGIKKIFIVTVLLFCCAFSGIDDDRVIWDKSKKLTWDDFLGEAPPHPSDDAVTSCGFDYRYHFIDDTLNFSLVASLDKYKSWVIHVKESDYLLNHEQRHFDLLEVYTRIFMQYVMKWDGKCNVNTYISEGNNLYFEQLHNTQTLYDNETDHSRNKPYQQLWDKKIDSLLNVYSSYENQLIKLPRRK